MNGTTTTIFGICFIFFMTMLGASLIFFMKKGKDDKANPFLSNLSGGIMLASSFFSLLLPAISSAESYGDFDFVPAVVGFLVGALFMFLLDCYLNKTKTSHFEGKRLSKNKKVFITLKDALVALAIASSTNDLAKKCLDKITLLRGCQLHSTCIMNSSDENTLRSLGVNITCEPEFMDHSLYENNK